MTIALLRRASVFAEQGAGPITILTFDHLARDAVVEDELRQRGRMWGGVSIENIWDWLRNQDIFLPIDSKRTPRAELLVPIRADELHTSSKRDGRELSRIRLAADGTTILQIDHFRADGTLLASDRRDASQGGVAKKRWITLCDMSGNAYKSWSKPNEFYQWVLDRIFDKQPVTLMIDSKALANSLFLYRRRNVLTVYVIHGAHVLGTQTRGAIVLRRSRHKSIQQIPAFDLVTTLTHRQRDDLTWLLGISPNLIVMPNSLTLPKIDRTRLVRDKSKGVYIGVFEARKRVPMAVEAIVQAHKHECVSLDVYGDGADMPAVENAVTRFDASKFIHLRGYSRDAAAKLTEKSFLLLTSESEGIGLVLLESLAVGCLPIAFDVPYGPSDLITHGKTGFLVKSGDVEGMAEQILQLQHMPEQRISEMRSYAIRSVEQYADQRVVELWADALAKAWRRKPSLYWRALRKLQARNTVRMLVRRNPAIEPVLSKTG